MFDIPSLEKRSEDIGLASSDTRFECTICGECCELEVELTNGDLERIGQNQRAGRFMDEILKGRSTLAACGERTACCFLRKNRCDIYSHRPLICRVYPFFPILAKDLQASGLVIPPDAEKIAYGSVEYYLSIDTTCPGLGRGQVPLWGEILSTWLQHVEEIAEGR